MNNFIRILTATLLLILFSCIGLAQIKIMAKPGEMFDLQELGAIILLKENKVKVEFVIPEQARHADYRDVDIKANDEIIIVNGKKISTTVELENSYKSLSIGEEVKLGIKRDDNLMLITFKKADPESLPKRKMMKIKVNESGQSDAEQEVEINGKKYKAKDGKVIVDEEEILLKDLLDKKNINKVEEE